MNDKGFYWDMIKMEVRGFCVRYTKRKNRERRNTEKHHQQQIDRLMNQLKTDRTKKNISKLYRLRAEYNTIAEYRTKGVIIRSRIRWHENGEKNTNISWIWKKDNIVNHTFQSLKQTTIWRSTTPKTILEQGKMFCKNLYYKNTCEIPRSKKSYLHHTQWTNYFYLSHVKILVLP